MVKLSSPSFRPVHPYFVCVLLLRVIKKAHTHSFLHPLPPSFPPLLLQELDDLTAAVRECNPAIEKFDTSCFNGVYVTGDVDAAYFQALKDHRSDSILSVDGGKGDDVDSLAKGNSNGSSSSSNGGQNGTSPPKGDLVRKIKELSIEEGDEETEDKDSNGAITDVDGVEAAKTSGQLGQARPRGRMIGAARKAAEDLAAADELAAADPANNPDGLRNEDMEKLRDRFSGWV